MDDDDTTAGDRTGAPAVVTVESWDTSTSCEPACWYVVSQALDGEITAVRQSSRDEAVEMLRAQRRYHEIHGGHAWLQLGVPWGPAETDAPA